MTLFSETIEIINVTDHSTKLIKFEYGSSHILISIVFLVTLFGSIFKCLIIKYVLCDAPKDRPINKLILVDQVRHCNCLNHSINVNDCTEMFRLSN